jgi:7,8-dihydropterin-6-yl-methyl-4-(beta-D-ribofuranosyl)aminobenzene 5'-phosphate synthase
LPDIRFSITDREGETSTIAMGAGDRVKVRITTLSDNTAGRGDFLAEWGLSILVETEDINVLLDTGMRICSSYNADVLGIDLRKVDRIVLSHGHVDHTGGLRNILRRMRKEIEIIAHPDIWAAKYGRRQGYPEQYIGVPYQRCELESLGAIFNLTTEPVRITDTVMTTGEIPMVTDFEEIDAGLFVREDAGWRPDKILDDQALIINSERGLVVVLGCAHRGIINTLYHARQLTGTEKIYLVLGGAHLMNASEDQLRQTIAALRELNIERLGLCHCTDLPATSVIAYEFGESFFFNKAGTGIDLT